MSQTRKRTTLTPAEIVLSQVLNGGFAQVFDNGHGERLEAAAEELKALGTVEGELLALACYGAKSIGAFDYVPASLSPDEAREQEFYEAWDARFEKLDEVVFKYGSPVLDRLPARSGS